MKDNFSSNSDQYAKFRPSYPQAFFEYLYQIIPNCQTAWDCGTGNGQIAAVLADRFEKVFATDISQSQLENASQSANIHYSAQAAEQTNFKSDEFDLIIVAQAIHWFDFEKFYQEVFRSAKQEALLCVVGYGLLSISPIIDELIANFYTRIIGPYWDEERKYIDEHYKTIPFPFEEIDAPQFHNHYSWQLEHLIGYLNTWSAVKHFIRKKGYNPVEELADQLQGHWSKEEIKKVSFPILLRIGKVNTKKL